MSHDRITPYDETCTIEDRIDEIVQSNVSVHIEMMDNANAWMRIGNEVFWINATRKGLVIRWSETEETVSPETAGKAT